MVPILAVYDKGQIFTDGATRPYTDPSDMYKQLLLLEFGIPCKKVPPKSDLLFARYKVNLKKKKIFSPPAQVLKYGFRPQVLYYLLGVVSPNAIYFCRIFFLNIGRFFLNFLCSVRKVICSWEGLFCKMSKNLYYHLIIYSPKYPETKGHPSNSKTPLYHTPLLQGELQGGLP